MGLDVTAFEKVVYVGDFDADNPGDTVRLYSSPDFPKQADGMKSGAYTVNGGEYDRVSMSYSTYNRWREALAKLAGYLPVRSRYTPEPSHAAGAWATDHGPFWELINFSDCEGLIGAATAKKLADDFAKYDDAAIKLDGDFYYKYTEFASCFKLASNGGAVKFH